LASLVELARVPWRLAQELAKPEPGQKLAVQTLVIEVPLPRLVRL
jgi:hypothetical protein